MPHGKRQYASNKNTKRKRTVAAGPSTGSSKLKSFSHSAILRMKAKEAWEQVEDAPVYTTMHHDSQDMASGSGSGSGDHHLPNIANDSDDNGDDNNDNDRDRDIEVDAARVEAVLGGAAPHEISNAGVEWEDMVEALRETRSSKRKYKDHRTRCDRTEKMNKNWAAHLDDLTEAYMAWSSSMGDAGLDEANWLEEQVEDNDNKLLKITVIDLYRCYRHHIAVSRTGLTTVAFVRQGLYPCSPVSPTVAISTRALELFHTVHHRCPRLSIQAFVKSLCDIHCLPFRLYLSQQFSIAYDLYLSIKIACRTRVQEALGRNTRDWRLANSCPSCQYKLDGEMKLVFDMLLTMDGNNSLKRLQRRHHSVDAEGNIIKGGGASRERMDSREGGGTYFLSRAEVDEWDKGAWAGKLATESLPGVDPTPCQDRWTNMMQEKVATMWGIFEETGVFPIICRHGFILLIADMVRSGEMAKYPLAVVRRVMDVISGALGLGYDIGCNFLTTMYNSPLGDEARARGCKALVGLFHGHAHNRLCQLSNLGTYVLGMGLEDLEGCERLFSSSNDLASIIRHASIFHRRQAIAQFAYHRDNFETYANLSKFLVENYKQALDILAGAPALARAMSQLNITDARVFDEWLVEERDYLTNLKSVPEEETLQMEYYKRLLELKQAEVKMTLATNMFLSQGPDVQNVNANRSSTARTETARRHTIENHKRTLERAQEMERRLGTDRWQPEDERWKAAKKLVDMAEYQRCVDKLESLIVARMFELTRMNMARTGYKLRRHIGQALKARSQAIRTALEHYNAAVAKLPSTMERSPLHWEQVVEYAFLADFDGLRNTREDVRTKLWSKPTGRAAMDQHFKMKRAREEIDRLNIEIRRLVTYVVDEDAYLRKKEEEVYETDPILAHHVRLHRLERGRFNSLHLKRLGDLSKLKGFTGTFVPGTGALSEYRETDDLAAGKADEGGVTALRDGRDEWAMDVDVPVGDDDEEDDSDEEEGEDDEQALVDAMVGLEGLNLG